MNSYLTTERQLIQEYEAIRPDLKAWGIEVDALISKKLIESKEVRLVKIPIEHRVKDEKSLLHKAYFGGMTSILEQEEVKEKLKKINDKVGTRVVVLNEADIERVRLLLVDNTELWKKPDVSRKLDKVTGEYKALHFDVYPKTSLSVFSRNYEPKELKILTCEVQVRTLLQHVYSEVSHLVRYKKIHKNSEESKEILLKIFESFVSFDKEFDNMLIKMAEDDKDLTDFFAEIVRIFLAIHPNYQKIDTGNKLFSDLAENSNHKLNNIILKLYDIQDIDIDDVKECCLKNKADIEKMIKYFDKESSYLRNEPIIVYLAFLVFTRPNSLKKRWIINDEILEDIFHSLNISYDN